MKSGTKQGKGQRSIQSFLFKPKATQHPPQAKPDHRILGEKQAAETLNVIPSNKKPRLSQTASHQKPLKPVKSLGQHANEPVAASQTIAIDDDTPELQTVQIENEDPPQALQHTVPARVEQRHQRFQQKLVMGAGNRTYRETKKLNAITKPKYTPLELQIVELKQKHPGVLLIVEVSRCIAAVIPPAHC